MIAPRPHVAALAPYALADPLGEGMVSLAQNESYCAPSPAALRAGQDALAQNALYPDPDWQALRDAIAQVHRLDAAHVLCGAGSMELIAALMASFVGPGDTVLASAYSYAFAATAVAQAQAHFVQVPELDLQVDVRAIVEALTPQTKVVFLCNPGNPTGTAIATSDILWLRTQLPDRVLLVLDQAYGEFLDPQQPPGDLFDLTTLGNTAVLRTMSKAYGLAGARVGWLYAAPPLLESIRKLLLPNNVTAVSQAMATAAMLDQDYMGRSVAQTIASRDHFCQDLRALGLQVPVSATNFVLVRFGSLQRAQQADQALRAHGVMTRTMAGYGLGDALRITVAAPDVMRRVSDVLRSLK
ncbi:MAG: histidinol-phosphate transaminase [Sedimentitalea sp.]